MALVQRNLLNNVFRRFSARYLGCNAANSTNIKKSVFISQSMDIYTNLALEDWIYRNFNFANHHILMLWRNEPCVVIGRHQNPWLEANVHDLENVGGERGTKLARRNSGGGTVYHDGGNLNMTFFTSAEHYNRRYNLEIVTRALFREYRTKIDITHRQDLTIHNYKVSGTASKLGRPNAYHHCTLLVDVNKTDMRHALQKHEIDFDTTATKSVKSNVMNLVDENPRITTSGLISAIGWEYLRTPALTVTDGDLELASKQNGFQMVNPTNQWFPGILDIKTDLESWDWCYGKTPKFTINRSFAVPDNLIDTPSEEITVTMMVENGRIADVSLFVPAGLSASGLGSNISVISSLKGHKFTVDALSSLEWSIGGFISDKDKFVTDCVKQVMSSV